MRPHVYHRFGEQIAVFAGDRGRALVLRFQEWLGKAAMHQGEQQRHQDQTQRSAWAMGSRRAVQHDPGKSSRLVPRREWLIRRFVVPQPHSARSAAQLHTFPSVRLSRSKSLHAWPSWRLAWVWAARRDVAWLFMRPTARRRGRVWESGSGASRHPIRGAAGVRWLLRAAAVIGKQEPYQDARDAG